MNVPALPVKGQGFGNSPQRQQQFIADTARFVAWMKQVAMSMDFKAGTRGWCYILEDHHVITKPEFDTAESILSDIKRGLLWKGKGSRSDGPPLPPECTLPVDFFAEDASREIHGTEAFDYADVDDEATWILDDVVESQVRSYLPRGLSQWDTQKHFVVMVVEKVDLRELFRPVCAFYGVPLTNGRGWSDIHSRAQLLRLLKAADDNGQRPVVLVAGDLDPGGHKITDGLRHNLRQVNNVSFSDGFELNGYDTNRIIVDRFGLNMSQVQAMRLPWTNNLLTGAPRVKCTDGKYRTGIGLDNPLHPDHDKAYVQDYLRVHGARKVEANALVVRPRQARRMARDAILRYVNIHALRAHRHKVATARRQLRNALVVAMKQRAA